LCIFSKQKNRGNKAEVALYKKDQRVDRRGDWMVVALNSIAQEEVEVARTVKVYPPESANSTTARIIQRAIGRNAELQVVVWDQRLIEV
jgi:hypothetical protein